MEQPCPPEIVHKILRRLHRVDLLNSRLVSQSWNKESLSILENSKYLLDLNEITLGEYVQFSQNYSETPLLMMNFSVDLTFGKDSKGQSEIDKFKSIASDLETLQTLFGPKCVRKLRFRIHADAHQLIRLVLHLLTKVNEGLKKLGFKMYASFGNQDDSFNNLPELNLPTVECLSIYSSKNSNTVVHVQAVSG